MNDPRILIVENDPAVRQKLYRAVLDVDLFSDCAADAADALDYLAKHSYTVLLLDLGIAGGVDAVLAALQTTPAGERPIILALAEANGVHGIDAELVQVIVRRPVRVREVAELARSCVDARSRLKVVPPARDEQRPGR